MTDYLFVYGTLKKGYIFHHYLKKSEFISEGYIKGYRMYLVSWYPAVVNGDKTVYGEVYKVDQKTLSLIDELEDEGNTYKRIIDDVFTQKGKIPCYIYLYLNDLKGLKEICSGRF